MPNKSIAKEKQERIPEMLETMTIGGVAKHLGINRETVKKYSKGGGKGVQRRQSQSSSSQAFPGL